MPVIPAGRPLHVGLIAAAASWGLFWGSWAALLPGLKDQVGATDTQLGLALFGIPAGALPAMVATAPLVRALRAWTLPVVLTAFAVACALPGLATSPLTFAGALLLVGATSGAIEVALNTTTAAHEARHGVRLFNKVHAATPLAMVLAAPAVGLARQGGAGPLPVLLVIAALVLLSALLAVDRSGWRAPAAEPGAHRSTAPLLIAFGLLAAVVLFLENAVEQWGALHLEESLGAGPLLGSAAPACYMSGLFAGRLLAQWRGDRVSGRVLLLAGGVLGAVGVGTAALSAAAGLPSVLALAGFAVAGVGLAPALPTLLGLAGAAVDDARRPGAIAAVTTLSYLGFLVSPPVVGVLAGAWGLTTALTAVACGGLVVAVASAVVRAPAAVAR